LVTYREGTAPSDVATLLAGLARDARHLPLRGLAPEEIVALAERVTRRSIHQNLAAQLAETTGGNPFFVREILLSLSTGGGLDAGFRVPGTVRDLLRTQISHLRPAAQEILRMLSIFGKSASLRLVAEAVGQPMDTVARTLEEAVAHHLLLPVSEQADLCFAHALVCETLYDNLSPLDRPALHRKVAELLETEGALVESRLSELAHHFLLAVPAVDSKKAIEYARRAGERAMRLLAYEEAEAHYQRALDAAGKYGSDPSLEVVLRLGHGHALLAIGRPSHAAQSFLLAAALAREAGDAEGFARAALGNAQTAEFIEFDPAKVRLLEEALHRLGPAESELKVLVLSRMATMLWMAPEQRGRREDLAREAVAMARRIGSTELLITVLDAKLKAEFGPANLDERSETALEILRLARETGDRVHLLDGSRWLLSALLERGEVARADPEIEAYARLAEDLRLPGPLMNATMRRGMRAIFVGRYDEGEALARRAWEIGKRFDDPMADFVLTCQLALVYIDRGSTAELKDLLGPLRTCADGHDPSGFARAYLAYVLSVLGKVEEARAEIWRLASRGFTRPEDFMYLSRLSWLAAASWKIGDASWANELLSGLAPYSDRNVVAGAAMGLGSAARYIGMLELLLGRYDAACASLEKALESNRRMGSLPQTAYAHADLARALTARGAAEDRRQAEHHRERALELARSIGMQGLLAVLDTPAAREVDITAAGEVLLRHEGAVIALAFANQCVRLKRTRGFDHLARLLMDPGRALHVFELTAEPAEQQSRHGLGPALDAKAKTAYQARYRALQDALEQAESLADSSRAAGIREELDALAGELARAVGLRGRDRVTGSAAERARVRVSVALRRATEQVVKSLPELGLHLAKSLKTGIFCAYDPDPRSRLRWRVEWR
jgi:tetratricopeptide (TPR) repeat protein